MASAAAPSACLEAAAVAQRLFYVPRAARGHPYCV
jgi:hypothetical protein